jgi:catechol 2,3-dioxygenase-like lactoylglutathione lyase family enzyme
MGRVEPVLSGRAWRRARQPRPWNGPIENAIEHLERYDVEIEVGPAERNGARGRGISVYFQDPDGSLMEFISYRA